MRNLVFGIAILFSAALCVAGYYAGRHIPFSAQWPLYEALRNTAAIIFAVVGAWLAIIYPDRLKLSFGRTTNTSGSGNIGLLLTPAIHSTIILVVLLLIGVLAPILKQVPPLALYLEECRGLSFLLLTTLTLWQIVIVVMTIIPADMVKSSTDQDMAKKKVLDHQNKLTRQYNPDEKI